MKFISLDLETLGTNVDSQIIQIGACTYDTELEQVTSEFEVNINLKDDKHYNITPGTFKFWLMQATENPDAVAHVFKPKNSVKMQQALIELHNWCRTNREYLSNVYANGTKFDLGMLEYQFNQHNITIPWFHNADRCMRTLKSICKERFNPNVTGYPEHSALGDAIWQAEYISLALASINKNGINI